MVDFEGNKHGGFDVENGGEKEFDMNSNSLQDAPASASPGSRILAADVNGVVVLPAGVSPEDIDTQGRDIVITLADGSTIIIPDGAIIVPQLVIDGVAIPPQTVAALLNGAEELNPEDQPGQLPSSGGEFDDGTSSLQDAFGLGDLLPYTELSREVVVEEEIIPFENEEPDVVIVTEDNPVGVENAIATVDEDGLPERGSEPGEPEGTRDETDSEITSGTIVFEAPDGLSAIILNGVEITSVGQTFTTIYGTLEITSIDLDSGEIGFIYTLEDNLLGETVDGNFTVTVVDRDGDTATANLSIIVIDDEPIAVLDTNTVAGGTYGPIHGNVLDNDESGADDYPEGEETVEAVISFTNGTDTAGPGETLTGQWGELTLNADGTYTYTRFYNTPGDQTDTFNYTIADQDGSTASADLVITIEDAPNDITFVPKEGEGTVVDESGLPEREGEPEGTEEPTDVEFTSGVIEFTSPDGVSAVIIAGQTVDTDNLPQTVVDDETGMLVITGYTYDPVTGKGTISYEYTLGDNTDEAEKSSVEFSLEIIDLDGDSTADNGPDSLVINIIDDVPEAKDDSDSVKEDDPEGGPVVADGNILTGVGGSDDNTTDGVADIEGADGASLISVTYGGDTVTIGEAFVADYGTITINADGSYTYTLDNDNPLIQGLSEGEAIGPEVFEYTIEDGDGDPSVAYLTINITGTDDDVTITGLTVEGPDVTVDEDDLPDGTDQTKEPTTQPDGDATFNFTSVDSLDTVKIGSMTFTAQDLIDNEGTGLSIEIAGTYGTLTIRGISVETAPDGSVIGGTFTYDYTLNTNTLDHVDPAPSAADEDSVFDDFAVVVKDVDGSEANATLTAEVIDDVPLTDENDAITLDDDDLEGGNPDGPGDEDSSVSTSGTLAHDFGADGGSIDFAVMDGEEVVIGGVTVTFIWDDGTSTLTANDGSNDVFEVVLNTATGEFTVNQLNPLDHHLVGDDYEGTPEFDLTYTVTDGDDDTATGTLTVRVNDDTPEFGEPIDDEQEPVELPKLYTDDTNVDPDTNATDSDSAFFSGLFNPLFGADGQAATDPIVYSFAIDGDNGLDSGLNDSITDENILLRVSDSDPNVIEGYLETSGDLAFTLTLDPETSEITQEQFRAIEHDDDDDHVEDGDAAESMAAGLIKLTATITDGDGDQAENTVDIGDAFNFEDDGPAFGLHLIGVSQDEDNIDGGNGDSAPGDNGHSNWPTYTFNIDFGADGAGADELTVSLSSVVTSDPSVGAIALTSGGDAVLFDWNAATNTWTGYTTDINDPVMTLVFDVDAGTVAVNVMQPLDHPSTDADGANNGPEIGYEDNLNLTFSITATDGDGDWVTTNLVVVIDDDMAVATDNALTVGEGESDGGDVILDDDGDGADAAGADGYAVDGPVVDADFVSGEQGITEISKDVAPDGTITIVTSAGTLVLNTDGTYTFDADANKVNADADIVFTYTIEDGDGDQTTANLTITIENVAGRVEDDDAYVDEGGLPDVGTGELNAPADDVDFDGEVDQDPESDQSEIDANGSIRALDNLGDPLVGDFTYSLTDPAATAGPGADEVTLIGDYGTLVLNTETGAYTYTLTTRYDHEDGLGENDSSTPPPADSFAYKVTDQFGNEIGTGSIDVTIKDDIPVIEAELDSGSTVSVDETDMAQGTATIDLDGNTQGSDNDVTGTPIIVSGSTAAGGNGVLNITTLLYGADGEAAGGGLDYDLVVNSSTSGLSTTEGLAINLVAHSTDSNVVLGMVDGTDIVAFAIEIDDTTGELTVEQYLSLQHTQPTDDLLLQLDAGSLQAVVSATDGDADEVSVDAIDITSLITFYDDDPSVVIATNGASVSVDESNLAVGDTTLDLGSFTQGTDADVADGLNPTIIASSATSLTTLTTEDYGADGEGTPDLAYTLSLNDGDTLTELATSLQTTEEQPITLVKVSDTLIVGEIGNTGVAAFAISINADTGEVTLEEYVSIEHGDNVPATSSVSLAASQLFVGVTIEDGDEDTATDYVAVGEGITFHDDTPTGGSNDLVQLDDDAWAGSDGNVGVAGFATDGAGTDDVVSNNTSGTLTHDFGNDGGSIAFATTGAPDGFRYQASGSDILIQQEQGTDNWVTVVTVTLNPATGAYTVTQNNNVLHDNAEAENNVEFTLSYTVTDGDEDTAPGTLVINVDDDTPVSTGADSLGTVDEDGVFGGNIDNGSNDVAGSDTEATGSVADMFSAGADAPLTYSFDTADAATYLASLSLSSGGTPLFYTITANSVVATAGNGGDPVFTMTLNDPSTGEWKFVLEGPLDHADTDDSENAVDIKIDFGQFLVATDDDGDSVDATGKLEITIDDDSPKFAADDTAAPDLVTDDDDITDTDSADFSTLFTPLYGADGQAATDPITYALSITGGDETDSGLVDTETGKSIYLFIEGGEIVGRVGDSNNDPDDAGAIAFTLSVNASGTIEQEQSRAIYHGDPSDPDEAYNADPLLDASETMAADLIKLTATITDGDGDSVDSTPISIGDSFHFEDDGPTLSNVTVGTGVSVDESTAVTPAGFPIDSTSAAPILGFTASFGADGDNGTSFTLNVTDPVSGLATAVGDYPIFLFKVGDTIEGQYVDTNGDGLTHTAFIVSVNNDPLSADFGKVTLTQNIALEHGEDGDNSAGEYNDVLDLTGKISATVKITDGDDDTASSTQDIGGVLKFYDDGPSADISTSGFSLTHDETPGNDLGSDDVTGPLAVFAGLTGGVDPDMPAAYATSTGAISDGLSDYGADDAGTSVFSLALADGVLVDSGLDVTGGGNIYLFKEGDLVVGRVGGDTGDIAFAVAIDASTGEVSLVQYLSIEHTNTASHDEGTSISADVLYAVNTVTDADGDHDTAQTSIGQLITFEDDGPTIDSVDNSAAMIPNEIGTYTDVSDVDFSYGADGAGSLSLANGTAIPGLYYDYHDDGSVTAYFDNGTPGDTGDDFAYFTASIDQTDGTVDVEVLSERPTTTTTTPLNFTDIAPGNYETVTIEGATFDGGSYAANETDPRNFINDGSTINPQQNGFGIGNNLISETEGFLFTYNNATALTFDVNFQPQFQQVTIYYVAVDDNNEVFSSSVVVTAASKGGIETVTIEGPNGEEFDELTLLFDFTNNKGDARVENFAVTETVTIFPDDQVISFDVIATDGDDDTETFTDGVQLTFEGEEVTPIVLDLDGGGNEFVSADAGVAYDYDGDGVKTKTAWIAAGSAILFHDTNGDGVVSDASEFVFGHDGMTDMEAVLKLYDSNNNGQLDQGDAEYGKFGVWMDDGDAQAEDGEFASLADMHITSIDLVSDGIPTVEGDGDVTVFGTSTFSIDGVVAGEASDAAFALGSDVDGAMMEALLAMSTEEGSDDGDTRTTAEVDVIVKDVLAEDAVDAMLNEITGHDEVQTADAGAFDAATLTHVIDGGAFVYDNSYAAGMDDHAAAELAAVHA